MFLERHFKEVPTTDITDPDGLILRHRQEQFCKRDPSTIKFSEMHGFNNETDGITCGELFRMVFVDGFQKNFWRWMKCECFDTVEQCFFVTVLAPYDILSALFTIFFPIIAMCTTPYEKWTLLQESLSFIYVFTLIIVIALSVYVYKFFRLSSSIFAPALSRTMPVVDDIIARWKDYIATRIRDDMVTTYFRDLAPIILEYAGPHRVHDTNWVPPMDWKNAGNISGVYLNWKNKKGPEQSLLSHPLDKGIYSPLDKDGVEIIVDSEEATTAVTDIKATSEENEVAGEIRIEKSHLADAAEI